MNIKWSSTGTLVSKKYVCGHCGEDISSQLGYVGSDPVNKAVAGRPQPPRIWSIYICHYCQRPTFIDDVGQQTPGPKPGAAVRNISDSTVESVYDEARRSFGAGAFTACVLCCRKLLMHIAVSKGAAPNLTFAQYVDFLVANHYVPIDAKAWVDHIRDKGNEANHEIVVMGKDVANDLLELLEVILKMTFEFPAKLKKGP